MKIEEMLVWSFTSLGARPQFAYSGDVSGQNTHVLRASTSEPFSVYENLQDNHLGVLIWVLLNVRFGSKADILGSGLVGRWDKTGRRGLVEQNVVWMEAWQTILLAIGGNTVLLAVLGWLARSVLNNRFARDLEAFKTRLSAESHMAIERLKHDLQLASTEHQIRFSRLHEKRGEVIAELYALLAEAHWATQSLVSLVEWQGEPSKKEKYVIAMNKCVDFFRFFDKHRIYLPEGLCSILEKFVKDLRKEAIGIGVWVAHAGDYFPEHAITQKFEAWEKAWKHFEEDVPKARAALEAELRVILGAR